MFWVRGVYSLETVKFLFSYPYWLKKYFYIILKMLWYVSSIYPRIKSVTDIFWGDIVLFIGRSFGRDRQDHNEQNAWDDANPQHVLHWGKHGFPSHTQLGWALVEPDQLIKARDGDMVNMFCIEGSMAFLHILSIYLAVLFFINIV